MPAVPPISPSMRGLSIRVALNKCRLRSGMTNDGATNDPLSVLGALLILVNVCYGPVKFGVH